MIFFIAGLALLLIMMWLDRNEWRRIALRWKSAAEKKDKALADFQQRVYKARSKDV